MLRSPKERNRTYLCPRCESEPLFFRVRSEILDVKVCVECGLKAKRLGLFVTELPREQVPLSVLRFSDKSGHASP
jgi:Zn ribbon nucleic-acid-binding protein